MEKYNTSFLELLTILFIGLKLLKVINWSWWLVLAPIWLPIALPIVGVVVFLVIALIKK
jgi:hypothetical protein